MSIVLRCDEILHFDHTGGIFTCDGCARDPYFCVPDETQSMPINIFGSERYSLDRIRIFDLLINGQEP